MSGQQTVIIPNRLIWMSTNNPPTSQLNTYFFTTDDEFKYEPYCYDFGPLNLAMTVQFCKNLDRILHAPEYEDCIVYYYCSRNAAQRINSAYLAGAYQILALNRVPEDSWKPFERLPFFRPYRDACDSQCSYKLTLISCFKGLYRAKALGWINYRRFNVQEYIHNSQLDNGDFNWIIPNKILAFSSPHDIRGKGHNGLTPYDFCKIFKRLRVQEIVRLNRANYNTQPFLQEGFKLHDLYFMDGTIPSDEIVEQFMEIAYSDKRIAVHCRAGLGRTGTLIGCYCIKRYNFSADEFIAWSRICRPGMVLGPQQHFLTEFEQKVNPNQHISLVQMNQNDNQKALQGDDGQSERLLMAKQRNQTPVPKQRHRISGRTFTDDSMLNKNEQMTPPKSQVIENLARSRRAVMALMGSKLSYRTVAALYSRNSSRF